MIYILGQKHSILKSISHFVNALCFFPAFNMIAKSQQQHDEQGRVGRTQTTSILAYGTSMSSMWEFDSCTCLASQCVHNLLLAHSGKSSRPYLHSYSILLVPQLWSKRNEKHYRTVEVTEGGKLELLLFSHKWNHHHLSELVTSQLQYKNQCRQTHGKRRSSNAASFRLVTSVVQNKLS